MKIAVVGTGYVGLVTGVCLAESGHSVTCVDIDQNKIKQLKSGQLPIYEPGLNPIFQRGLSDKRLNFNTDLAEAVKTAEVIYLALPTPSKEDGSADLSYILGVTEKLAPYITNYKVIVNKSTVPVGTAELVRKTIGGQAGSQFDVVSNPEFLREGLAVSDFMNPDRIIVGTKSKKAKKIMTEVYAPFTTQAGAIIFMDERSAELTKYAANAFLAMKISFMNEVANLSELVGANVDDIRQGIGTDERIGHRFLFPGIGYGGSCFPKDVKALNNSSLNAGYPFRLLEATMTVNARQKQVLTKKIKSHFKDKIADKKFALWGLAFKPNTDDIREAPSLDLIDSLLGAGAHIYAYDPEAGDNVKQHYGYTKNIKIVDQPYKALEKADALIITTEWQQFREPDFGRIKKALKSPVIFDGRNIYDPDMVKSHGFYYASIGRPVVDGR